jgi:hypothetical protein
MPLSYCAVTGQALRIVISAVVQLEIGDTGKRWLDVNDRRTVDCFDGTNLQFTVRDFVHRHPM